MNRRHFLKQVAGTAALASLGLAQTPSGRKYRVALIGYTGHGNYGHGHDVDFNDHPNIEVVAVADPNPAGRAKAQIRSRARNGYGDYREMLEKERPDLVAVCTRWSGLHYERVLAALQAGAHVFCEKPFTENLAQADDLLALADRQRLKIAVAHQIRLAPNIVLLKQRLQDGLIGELLELRLEGKDDKRAGGEDMVVLGGHEFDLARFYTGSDALWCSARVEQDDREVTRSDIHPATEGDGPVVGNRIQATFAFPGGINAHYSSDARYQSPDRSYSVELIGSRGSAWMSLGFDPIVYVGRRRPHGHELTESWTPLAGEGTAPPDGHDAGQLAGNRRVVDDWIAAIEADREPACSGRAATKALEMIHAVFTAGLSHGRVALPLADRRHPLAS